MSKVNETLFNVTEIIISVTKDVSKDIAGIEDLLSACEDGGDKDVCSFIIDVVASKLRTAAEMLLPRIRELTDELCELCNGRGDDKCSKLEYTAALKIYELIVSLVMLVYALKGGVPDDVFEGIRECIGACEARCG